MFLNSMQENCKICLDLDKNGERINMDITGCTIKAHNSEAKLGSEAITKQIRTESSFCIDENVQ